ncbi:glycosyltransferase family 2 protein [Streptomyces sp. MP131-18]|uniref:glycosyltransferase family 2 protein n=1 Tax=Streptomyces sp. MP131-18 TaxID=1857892 RepID=UPI00097C9BB0|nr:glycosyltransferase family 2 protein [Streptomyces sp. MP131-18]ONK10470.1 Galactofuranosyl transferase GlfT1 [Streptomyces sp. MP131-18]
MTVAALVVSHNRCDLLRKCLSALLAQTRSLDEILVVDNNSSDGSVDMMRREFPSVTVVRTRTNIGGAGGFSLGVDTLLGRGHSFAWLMDDDAEPREDALEPLLSAMHATGNKSGFVASTVLAPDGTKIPSHIPLRIPVAENRGLSTPSDTYPAAHSTFVGVLINLETARSTYLPISDFFIWWDDSEYTSRLQTLAGGLASTTSIVAHPNKPEWKDLGSRLRFDVRNRIWLLKHRRLGSARGRERAAEAFWSGIWSQARNARRKDLFVRYLVQGLWEGVFTRPRPVLPARPPD